MSRIKLLLGALLATAGLAFGSVAFADAMAGNVTGNEFAITVTQACGQALTNPSGLAKTVAAGTNAVFTNGITIASNGISGYTERVQNVNGTTLAGAWRSGTYQMSLTYDMVSATGGGGTASTGLPAANHVFDDGAAWPVASSTGASAIAGDVFTVTHTVAVPANQTNSATPYTANASYTLTCN